MLPRTPAVVAYVWSSLHYSNSFGMLLLYFICLSAKEALRGDLAWEKAHPVVPGDAPETGLRKRAPRIEQMLPSHVSRLHLIV